MKRSKFIVLFLLFVPFVMNAQTPLSPKERRLLNFKALSTIEQYEMSQHLRDSDSEYIFENIFQSKDQLVFCDLVDYKSCKNIPLSEYMKAIKRRSSIFMEIGNLKRSQPIYKRGRWVLPVSFTKSVSYIDKHGLDFSTKNYYKSDYIISMELAWDKSADRCYIAHVSGGLQNSNVSPLPDHFIVVKKTDGDSKHSRKDAKFDEKLRYGKEPLKFDFNEKYAILSDPTKKVTSWNYDVHIKADTLDKMDAYDLIRYKYNTNHMRVKLRGAVAVGNVFNTKICGNSNISVKSKGYETGVDIGAAFFAGRSSQIGFYTGAACTYTSINMIYTDASLNNKYQLVGKIQQDTYPDSKAKTTTKDYNIVKAEEALRFTDITIPVYINFEHYLHKSLVLTWNLGAKMYINGQTEYCPLVITENNDQSTTINRFLSPTSYARDLLDFSVIGGIALNVNLYKNLFYTYAKFSYEYGLHSLFNSEYNFRYRKSLINNVTNSNSSLEEFCDSDKKIYPVVYDGTKKEYVANRSMLNSVYFDRATMWVEFGFMFKF
uniref:hypothetical protein n=1 Tax=Alistipes sp. TaxID=1872444 RepID=UPI0040575BF8